MNEIFSSLSTDDDEELEEAPEPESVKPIRKFRIYLYLRVMSNKTLRPAPNKDTAHYTIKLICEYPTYEEEIQAKRECTIYDEYHSLHYVDIDALGEWRVRRCLRSWDFYIVLPGFPGKLRRDGNLLTEESLKLYHSLPPLIRKEILVRVWNCLGNP
jgi:hypothetical protein